MNVYPFTAAEKAAAHHVATACALLEASTSAYYQWSQHTRSRRECADRVLGGASSASIGKAGGRMGHRACTAGFASQGTACGRRRVARLMAMQGLTGRCKCRSMWTTVADPAGRPAATALVCRAFAPASLELDRVCVCDITYLRTWEG